MKRTILFFGLLLTSVFVVSALANNAVPPIEYVRICQDYGDGWYYIPGTDRCIFPTTGQIQYTGPNGPVTAQSELAYRVAQLEQRLAELKALKKQKTGK